jgi:hypothetical protein
MRNYNLTDQFDLQTTAEEIMRLHGFNPDSQPAVQYPLKFPPAWSGHHA